MLLLPFPTALFADENMQMQPSQTEERGEAFQRAVDNVRERGSQQGQDIFQRWGTLLFGDKTSDPLASDQEAARTQAINEGVGDRAQTAAEFTEAATSVVTAGAPSPTTASQVGTMVVSEGTSAIVQSQTTPPPQEPGVFQRIINWIGSWFK